MLNFYVLAPLGALMFFVGFFPIAKVTNHVTTEPPTSIDNTSLHPERVYRPTANKTVLFIIDALRFDFITPTLMPLTWNITKNTGCFNLLKAETPTVTLPRIKALIAGSVPQFIDLVLNLFGTEALMDSLVHSAVESGLRLVFYGDDTWLKLFPDKFVRHEGTHSFFVRDFTEVDDNVTRNVEAELERDDWDIMILHYLGLDHIGHVHGPHSRLVAPKLAEMDRVVHRIFTALNSTGLLLFVTGDHGMRDGGGHGGSTYPETNVPFLTSGVDCTDGGLVAQTDVPANVAALLGLRIPSTSVGAIRSQMFSGLGLERYLYAARYNGLVLRKRVSGDEDLFDLAERNHVLYLRGLGESYGVTAGELYGEFCGAISESLTEASVRQNLVYVVTGGLILSNVILTLLCQLLDVKRYDRNLALYGSLCLLPFVDVTYIIYLPLLSVIFLVNLKSVIQSGLRLPTSVYSKCLVLLVTIHPLTFASSSFVEEEHQYWYFSTVTLLVLLSFRTKSVGLSFLLSGCFRFVRSLNSTGDQWADWPDVSDWLSDRPVCYQMFFVAGLLLVVACFNDSVSLLVTNFVIVLSIFAFKYYGSSYVVGRILWLSISAHLVWFKRKIDAWALICCLLLKPHNVILVPYCIVVSAFVRKYLTTFDGTLFHIFLSNSLYFAQGHSNSLASVDVSAGYVGLSEYNGLVVTLQVLLHTYAFPVLCYSLVLGDSRTERDTFWGVVLLDRLYTFVVVALVTFIQRHHLFIWSVFAPKLFVETVHVLVLSSGYLLYQVGCTCLNFRSRNVLNRLNKVLNR